MAAFLIYFNQSKQNLLVSCKILIHFPWEICGEDIAVPLC